MNILKIILTLLVGISLNAESKSKALSADESLKVSGRQAIFLIDKVGMKDTNISKDIIYYPYAKKAKPYSLGSINVHINSNSLNKSLYINKEYLITKRYDIITLNSNKIVLKTPTKEVVAKTNSLKSFNINDGINLDSYTIRVKNYLSSSLAPITKIILKKSLDARYENLDEKEKATFMSSIAKSSSIPFDIASSLFNSSYVFSLYQDSLSSSVYVTQDQHTDMKGRVYYTYTINFSIDKASYTLALFEFKDFKYKHYRDFNASSATSTSKRYKRRPTLSQIKSFVKGSYSSMLQAMLKQALIDLSIAIKEDNNFVISSIVTEVNSMINSTINIGVQEDIRVDQPFKFVRDIDGELQIIGSGKVKKLGNNCLKLKDEDKTYSKVRILYGNIEEYDKAIEIPYSGVFSTYYFTQDPTVIADNWGGYKPTWFNFGIGKDKGFLENIESQRESYSWFTFGLAGIDNINSIKFTPQDSYIDGNLGSNDNWSGIVALKFDYILEEKIHLLAKTSLSYGFDCGTGVSLYDGGTTGHYYLNKDDELKPESIYLYIYDIHFNPYLKLSYNPSVYTDIFIKSKYTLSYASASIGWSDSDTSLQSLSKFPGYIPSIAISFGVNLHNKSTIPFGSSFRKNSSCN